MCNSEKALTSAALYVRLRQENEIDLLSLTGQMSLPIRRHVTCAAAHCIGVEAKLRFQRLFGDNICSLFFQLNDGYQQQQPHLQYVELSFAANNGQSSRRQLNNGGSGGGSVVGVADRNTLYATIAGSSQQQHLVHSPNCPLKVRDDDHIQSTVTACQEH